MKNLSVHTFIHILFSVAIAILIATFLLFVSWDKDRQKIELYKRYQLIAITFLSNLQLHSNEEALNKLYHQLKVRALKGKQLAQLKEKIKSQAKTVFNGGSSLGQVRVFRVEDKDYIYVQRMEHNLMLVDARPPNRYFEIAVGLGVFLITLLLLLYLAVLKKLHPLKNTP